MHSGRRAVACRPGADIIQIAKRCTSRLYVELKNTENLNGPHRLALTPENKIPLLHFPGRVGGRSLWALPRDW